MTPAPSRLESAIEKLRAYLLVGNAIVEAAQETIAAFDAQKVSAGETCEHPITTLVNGYCYLCHESVNEKQS